MTLWIDGDSCHRLAMERALRVEGRQGVRVHVVADRDIPAAAEAGVALTVLTHGAGSVDATMIRQAVPGDIAVTRDLELAHRLLLNGVRVLNDRGRIWNEKDLVRRIEEAGLMTAMRAGGMVHRGMPVYDSAMAAAFSESLDTLISSS